MCKRFVERYRNEPKRARTEEKCYTQGPLDEVFGQHRAFPLDGEADTSEVYQFLASVRQQAEQDSAVHFVEREEKSGNGGATNGDRSLRPLSSEYISQVMARLQSEKSRFTKEPELTISMGDFDLTGATEEEEEQEENPEQEPIDASTDATNEASPGTSIPQSASQWRQLVFSESPPPLEFFYDALEHTTVIKLIIYYTKWLSVSMPQTLSEWVFSTFVRLDNGLDHNDLSLVRELGKKARRLRAKFEEGQASGVEVPHAARTCVDMILAVVGDYYGQKDLLE